MEESAKVAGVVGMAWGVWFGRLGGDDDNLDIDVSRVRVRLSWSSFTVV